MNLKKILTTHHHWDHAGGNKSMHEKYKNVEILGGDERIEAINQIVSHDDTFNIGSLNVKCLATPCHTSGHICYLVTDDAGSDPPAVFTGDTLFIGGCGRFFEGTPGQMFKALNEILGSLPDETVKYFLQIISYYSYTFIHDKYIFREFIVDTSILVRILNLD